MNRIVPDYMPAPEYKNNDGLIDISSIYTEYVNNGHLAITPFISNALRQIYSHGLRYDYEHMVLLYELCTQIVLDGRPRMAVLYATRILDMQSLIDCTSTTNAYNNILLQHPQLLLDGGVWWRRRGKKKSSAMCSCNLFGSHLLLNHPMLNDSTADGGDGHLLLTPTVLEAINQMKLNELHSSSIDSQMQSCHTNRMESSSFTVTQVRSILDVISSSNDGSSSSLLNESLQLIIDMLINMLLETTTSNDGPLITLLELNSESYAFNVLYNVILRIHLILDGIRLDLALDCLFDILLSLIDYFMGSSSSKPTTISYGWRCLVLFMCKNDGYSIDMDRLNQLYSNAANGHSNGLSILLNYYTQLKSNQLFMANDEYLLTCMISNMLLLQQEQHQTKALPHSKGNGIGMILEKYAQSASTNCSPHSIDSLFAVIYNNIIWSLKYISHIDIPSIQSSMILDILRTLDAPQYLWQIVLVVPDKFVERFVRYIYLDEIKKDIEWFTYYHEDHHHIDDNGTSNSHKIPTVKKRPIHVDKTLLVAILYDFERRAKQLSTLVDELQHLLPISDKEHDIDGIIDMIKSLFESSDEGDTRQACLFMYKAMVPDAPSSSLLDTSILSWLTRHQDNERTSDKYILFYLDIIQRILLSMKYRLGEASSRVTVSSLMTSLNSYMLRIFYDDNEQDSSASSGTHSTPRKLHPDTLKRIMDIILSFIIMPTTEKLSFREYTRSYTDTVYELFLNGRYMVKSILLNMLDIRIFHCIFCGLATDHSQYDSDGHRDKFEWMRRSSIKGVALHLMIEQCSSPSAGPSCIQSIPASKSNGGGMAFFREQVMSNDARIALLASQFLIAQLSREKPDQYDAVLVKLSQKLGIEKDELVANPYLEIRAIMGQRR